MQLSILSPVGGLLPRAPQPNSLRTQEPHLQALVLDSSG